MVPKKPIAKTMKKPVEKPITKIKKHKKKNYQSFSIYIYKILKSVSKDMGAPMGISRKSMLIMDNFVNDMLEKIAMEAGRLVMIGKKTTMGSREVQTALRLLLPGELSKHANIEGIKAITLYHRNIQQETAEKT